MFDSLPCMPPNLITEGKNGLKFDNLSPISSELVQDPVSHDSLRIQTESFFLCFKMKQETSEVPTRESDIKPVDQDQSTSEGKAPSSNLATTQTNQVAAPGRSFLHPLVRTERQVLGGIESPWNIQEVGRSIKPESEDIFAMFGSSRNDTNQENNQIQYQPPQQPTQSEFADIISPEDLAKLLRVLENGTPEQKQEITSLFFGGNKIQTNSAYTNRANDMSLVRSPSPGTHPIRSDIMAAQMSTSRRDWNAGSPSNRALPPGNGPIPPKFSLSESDACQAADSKSPTMSSLSGLRTPVFNQQMRSNFRRTLSDGDGSTLTERGIHGRSQSTPQMPNLGPNVNDSTVLALTKLMQTQQAQQAQQAQQSGLQSQQSQQIQIEAIKRALGMQEGIGSGGHSQFRLQQMAIADKRRPLANVLEEQEPKRLKIQEPTRGYHQAMDPHPYKSRTSPSGTGSLVNSNLKLGREARSSQGIRVRKENTSDRIAILRQLIAPQLQRGDTATVLGAVIDYLQNAYKSFQERFLTKPGEADISAAGSLSKLNQSSPKPLDLRRLGYCLVPISSGEKVAEIMRQ